MVENSALVNFGLVPALSTVAAAVTELATPTCTFMFFDEKVGSCSTRPNQPLSCAVAGAALSVSTAASAAMSAARTRSRPAGAGEGILAAVARRKTEREESVPQAFMAGISNHSRCGLSIEL